MYYFSFQIEGIPSIQATEGQSSFEARVSIAVFAAGRKILEVKQISEEEYRKIVASRYRNS